MSTTLWQTNAGASARTIGSWQPHPGSYLVFGRSTVQLPRSGSARSLSAAAGVGIFRSEAWKLPDGCNYGFIAIIRLPGLTTSNLADIALRGSRLSDREFLLTVAQQCDCLALGSQLAELAIGHQAHIARFLVETATLFRPEEKLDLGSLLHAYLGEAAEDDGHIELVLSISDRRVILQGWGTQLAEPVHILIPGAEKPMERLAICEFQRNDLPIPSVGCILVSDLPVSDLGLNSTSVFLLTGDRLLARRSVGSQMLFADDALGQLRHLLPKLRCPQPLYAELKALLQPTYQGIDTLAGADRSVRAAIDLAVSNVLGGVYLSGWILDPFKSIVDIELSDGATHRSILNSIVWVERQDVISAFKAELSKASYYSLHCGFSAQVELGDSSYDRLHLRFSFQDGEICFLPIRPQPFSMGEPLGRLLSSVDLHKGSGAQIIDTVLGPFLRRALGQIHAKKQGHAIASSEDFRALIVPLNRGELPRSLTSGLLHDRCNENEKIILVCDSDWDNQERARLSEFLRFYSLRAEVITTDLATSPVASILEITHSVGAKKSIVQAQQITGMNANTRQQLFRQLDEFDLVSPTILQEDGTFLYAGTTSIDFLDRPPFSRVRAGTASVMAKAPLQRAKLIMTGGSLACCAMRSDAVAALLGLVPQLTRTLGEAALFAKSEQLGLRGKWDSSITVVAPENHIDEPLVKHVVDSWLLRSALEPV